MKAGGRTPVGSSHHWRTITLHSLPVLFGAVAIGVFAGQILAFAKDDLLRVPVLLALVPAVNGIGGNVGSILGARVASGLHVGGLWSNRGRGFRRDVTASLILALITFSFLGIVAGVLAPPLGLDLNVDIAVLGLTTLLAGTWLVGAMVLLTIVVGMLSHRHGWDPDNIVVPVLTTAGDTLGILFLLLSAQVIGL